MPVESEYKFAPGSDSPLLLSSQLTENTVYSLLYQVAVTGNGMVLGERPKHTTFYSIDCYSLDY